jgi:hypothetical protein
MSGAGRRGLARLHRRAEGRRRRSRTRPSVPYYRDDACLDDGTGDDPVSRPWPGEASTDQRVKDGYSRRKRRHAVRPALVRAAAGRVGRPRHPLLRDERHRQRRVARTTHRDRRQQWQFMVPTAAPTNVGAGVRRTSCGRRSRSRACRTVTGCRTDRRRARRRALENRPGHVAADATLSEATSSTASSPSHRPTRPRREPRPLVGGGGGGGGGGWWGGGVGVGGGGGGGGVG